MQGGEDACRLRAGRRARGGGIRGRVSRRACRHCLERHAARSARDAGRHPRDAFFAQEIAARKRVAAPPFGRLAAIILASHDGAVVREAGRALARAAPKAVGVKIWGPTPAFYQLLRGRTRERLLVQAEKSVDVQAYLRAWLARVKLPNAVRLTVDIDPVSFF